jgi:hypothetical protein
LSIASSILLSREARVDATSWWLTPKSRICSRAKLICLAGIRPLLSTSVSWTRRRRARINPRGSVCLVVFVIWNCSWLLTVGDLPWRPWLRVLFRHLHEPLRLGLEGLEGNVCSRRRKGWKSGRATSRGRAGCRAEDGEFCARLFLGLSVKNNVHTET